MLIWTAKFSKKKAVFSAVIFGTVMAGLILLAGRLSATPIEPDVPQLDSNEARVAYLHSLGWEVFPEPVETLQFLLPATLSEPYTTYNQLQLSQGFDLSACCGKQISRYTYTVSNHPDRAEGVQANLYLCEEIPVAGDICCPGINGFQEPLIQEQT